MIFNWLIFLLIKGCSIKFKFHGTTTARTTNIKIFSTSGSTNHQLSLAYELRGSERIKLQDRLKYEKPRSVRNSLVNEMNKELVNSDGNHQFTYSSNTVRKARSLALNEPLPSNIIPLYLCYPHIMKMISRYGKTHKVKPETTKLFLEAFATLVHCKNINIFDQLVESLFVILLYPFKCLELINALKFFSTVKYLKKTIDSENCDVDEDSITVDSEAKTDYESSPYFQRYVLLLNETGNHSSNASAENHFKQVKIADVNNLKAGRFIDIIEVSLRSSYNQLGLEVPRSYVKAAQKQHKRISKPDNLKSEEYWNRGQDIKRRKVEKYQNATIIEKAAITIRRSALNFNSNWTIKDDDYYFAPELIEFYFVTYHRDYADPNKCLYLMDEDYCTLYNNNWLSNGIIDYYSNIVVTRSRFKHCVGYTSCEMSYYILLKRCLNVGENFFEILNGLWSGKTSLILPLNINDSHWTLLYVDTDSFNCGVYVLHFIEEILKSNVYLSNVYMVSKFDPMQMRERLKEDILTRSLSVYDQCLRCGQGEIDRNPGWIMCEICEKHAHYSCLKSKYKETYAQMKKKSFRFKCDLCNLRISKTI
ncbi:hypothetical protein KQX54_013544 [Cotesia glomerata]|uniref:Ubiquitin-like protease family profile domain-containing protein n=1 Tax=Cotesia glomerata TaxID=32391 RepID=A0AAV7IHC2_COTGL|nr:hypothetical protein KQX54_013544 [Cotesia glomerata]